MVYDFQAPKYHIFGDSNVNRLLVASQGMRAQIAASGFPLGLVRALGAANEFYAPFYELSDSKLRITDPKLKSRLEGELCDENGFMHEPDGSLWLISGGFHTLGFLNSARWDTHRLWRVGSDRQLAPISDGAFKAMVLDLNRFFLGFLRDAMALGYRMAVLSSAPPTERFVERLASKKWTRDEILLMDGAVREVMTTQLAEMGIALITPPDDVAKDGFLKSEYLMANLADSHHGDVEYSKKYLGKIAETCGYSVA